MSLLRFLLRRTGQGVLVVWGVVTVVFGLRFVTPGDPEDVLLPPDVPPETRRRIAEELGLNRPPHVQYVDYLAGLVTGDLGTSLESQLPVAQLIVTRLPRTLELAVVATLVAVVISIPLGVISATRRNRPPDYAATVFSLLGISTPNFWLGVMLVILLAVQFNLFPTSRPGTPIAQVFGALLAGRLGAAGTGLVDWAHHIALPSITLGTYFTALITRLTRSGMLEEMGKDYVRAARAKGLPESMVRYKHALRNTLIPVVTVVGLQLGALIGGAVITEAVFNWRGLGTLIIESIRARDWPVIQGSIIVVAVGFVVVNLLVDLLYAALDPEVGYE